MFFYILSLVVLTAAYNYTFDDAKISLSTVSTTSIVDYSSSPDTCGKLIVWINQVYHLSTTNVFQSSVKGALPTHTSLFNVSTLYDNIDYSVNAI